MNITRTEEMEKGLKEVAGNMTAREQKDLAKILRGMADQLEFGSLIAEISVSSPKKRPVLKRLARRLLLLN